MSRRKILIFIDWFYPAYKAGGPIKSVFNIATQLKEEFEFKIVSSNQDVDGKTIQAEPDVWLSYKGVKVIYLSKQHQKQSRYKELFLDLKPDLIYYNSLFSYRFTLLPYLLFKKSKIKQMIAPRGMLGEGALSIKPLKKKIFLWLAKYLIFERELTYWHATSEQEAIEINAALGSKVAVRIAKNLSSTLHPRKQIIKQPRELKLVFVSRISEKKNLLFILELFASLEKELNITLCIYGPIEDQVYWRQCNSIIEENPNIEYKGLLRPDEVAVTLQKYHFFILPTLHENYGHSIVESILSGLPVIISKKTPWNDLQESGIGIDLSLKKKDDWLTYLLKKSAMEQEEYERMVSNCYVYAKQHILDQNTLQQSKELFSL